jgi:hypothetical protein
MSKEESRALLKKLGRYHGLRRLLFARCPFPFALSPWLLPVPVQHEHD